MQDGFPPLRAGEWLILVDGSRALAFEASEAEEAGGARVRLRLQLSADAPAGPARDFGSDRPGRLQPASGMAISAVEQADGHEWAEAAFLRSFAKDLDGLAADGRLTSAVLAAPARAMGLMRTAMSERLRGAIRHEVVADLVHTSLRDLETRFLAQPSPD